MLRDWDSESDKSEEMRKFAHYLFEIGDPDAKLALKMAEQVREFENSGDIGD